MIRGRSIVGIFILLTFFTISMSGSAAAKKQKKIKFKIGSYITPSSPWGKAVSRAMSKMEKRTDGAISVKHLHSGMLGSNKNMLEQVLIGGIQAAGVDTSALATIVPEMNVLELPFLFRDRDEAYFLIDEIISPYLQKKMEKKGLVTSAIMEVGFMDFVMSGPIRKPADLKTKKIGCWESPVHIAFWKSLGANPIPIPATEVMGAYMRGMVDSGANSPSALVAWDKLFGAGIKREKIFITKTSFTYHAGIIVVNKNYFYRKFSPEMRAVFHEEMLNMTMNIRKGIGRAEPGAYKKLASLKYQIVELTPEEKAVFVDKSQKVYKEFEEIIGTDFMKELLDARRKYRERHPRAD